MPTASNSASSRARCSARFVASRTIRIKSLVYHRQQMILIQSTKTKRKKKKKRKPTLAAEITCLPRPFPSAAPSMIPGKSRIWISAPPSSNTPGIAVSVVNEYAAASLLVLVILDRKVDLPTEGKPTRATRASPLLLTSKPEPPPPLPPVGSRSWALRRASFLILLAAAWLGSLMVGRSTP